MQHKTSQPYSLYTEREAYNWTYAVVRAEFGRYDAFDKRALDRVAIFNELCKLTNCPDAVDAAFRSWEALGIHRPRSSSFESKRVLSYRRMVIQD